LTDVLGEDGPADDLRAVGERIERLLDRLERTAPNAFADVETLVRLLTDLYGAGLVRAIELGGPELARRLAEDELLASLMLVHDIHPDGLEARAAAAVAAVVPKIEVAGGTVELVAVSASAGTVHLVVRGHKPDPLGDVVRKSVADALPDATVTVTTQESGTPIRLGRKPLSVQ
jgi:hypothetical protein